MRSKSRVSLIMLLAEIAEEQGLSSASIIVALPASATTVLFLKDGASQCG